MKRRDALKGLGALAGAAAAPRLLTGCDGKDISDGEEGPPGIHTIVVVCMENRSYDHYLGARALEGLGGDGLRADMSNPRQNGSTETVFRETMDCILDPPHSWSSSRRQFAEGTNSGFLREYEASFGAGVPPHPMGYLGRDELPFLWSLADAYASCDRWFCSLLGPTWPNRMYLHSGQSGGLTINELPTAGGINWPSIHHQLNDAGIDWAYYYQDLPFVPLFQNLDTTGHVRRVNHDFFKDAEAGTLPPVVWVEPNFDLNDDHPPHHPMLGQQFLASVYTALANSPQWPHCLLVITYDEHGGFFDHVPPPLADDERAAEDFDQLGFRVPTVVAGPYVKTGHVSSVVRDHTSVLKHIAKTHGLPPLTDRVAWAPDLDELIDQERLAAGQPLPPAAMPAIEIDESQITEACYRLAPSQPELAALADAGVISKHFDRRRFRRDDAYSIAEVLDFYGQGRIRRNR